MANIRNAEGSDGMKKTSAYKRIVGFVLIALMLACVLPMSACGDSESDTTQSVTIVRAIRDIAQGEFISKEDIELKTVENIAVPSNALADIDEAVGHYAKEPLYKGEYIHNEQLSKNPVQHADYDPLIKTVVKNSEDYVTVTDYVVPNTGEDVSYHLQKIIDVNPGRTIYFPDGEYSIAYPLIISAAIDESVSLRLSDGAVIKAHAEWKGKNRYDGRDALVRVGADDSNTDDFISIGAYYSVIGGTLDGNFRANGINIEGGLEVVVRDICVRNAVTGVLIKDGVHNHTSAVDVEDLVIIGDGAIGETGVLAVGLDNTITNVRIYNMPIGLKSTGGGNFIKGIFVKNSDEGLMREGTQGIISDATDWISQCYVENFNTAYGLADTVIFSDNRAVWTGGCFKTQNAFVMTENGISLSGCCANFDPVEDGTYVYQNKQAFIEGAISDTEVAFAGLDGVSVIPCAK